MSKTAKTDKKLLKEAQIRRFQQLAGFTVLREMGSPLPGAYKDDEFTGDDMDLPEEDPMDEAPVDDLEMAGEEELELTDEEVQALEDAMVVMEKIVAAAGGGEEEVVEEEEPLPEDLGEELPGEEPLDEEPGNRDFFQENLSVAAKKLLSDPKILREVAKRVAKRLS
jgi:hypothetical protein